MSYRTSIFAFTCSLLVGTVLAELTLAQDDAVEIRVVDVGSGECCVIKMPGDHYMIYDTGNFKDGGQSALNAIREIIPQGDTIDLLIISHSDADHAGGTPDIIEEYEVDRVIRTGLERDTQTWIKSDTAITEARRNDELLDINLRYFEFPPGATYRFGDVFVTFVCGFHTPPFINELKNSSERRNGGSIVIRLEYQGNSVLFCGDAVGRHNGDPDDVCIATEKYMIDNSPVIKIDSDVIIAPHHGADNGSSNEFIRAVSPTFVIFSAGHKHKHPRASTANRYLNNGVLLENIFRTDRGDNEGGPEWDHQGTNEKDGIGDDDVEITLPGDGGDIVVEYRSAG